MEEAKKRKEKLQALRMEAEKAEVSDCNLKPSAGSSNLFSPLIDSSAGVVTEEESRVAPRFDFYTDPMSAFSANRKKNQTATQISQSFFSPPKPWNPEVIHTPHQCQSSYSSSQRIQQAQGPYYRPVLHASPGEMVSHAPGAWKRSVVESSYGSRSNFPRGGDSPAPVFQPNFSPTTNYRQGGGQYHGNYSAYGSGRGGSPSGPAFQPHFSPSINYGQGRSRYHGNYSAYGLGRDGSPSPSPNPSSGRGRGCWNRNSMSPASGWGGDERKGPDQYFLLSMLEDPWKNLNPVIKKVDALSDKMTPGSSKSWSNKSFGMKRARVSEAPDKSRSQPSLAEILAASFNEACNDN